MCFSPFPILRVGRFWPGLADRQLTITALAEPFAISFVAVSKHIRVLEDAGLLKRSKQGREYHLRLVPEPLRDAADWLNQYDRFWTDHLVDIKSRAEQKARQRSESKPNSQT